jgi:putative transposase
MPQSLARVLLHIVFSTKNREPFINTSIQSDLHAYLAAVGRDLGCEVFRVGGVADHVHMAVDLSRTITVADFVKKVKQTSSAWIKDLPGASRQFEWQAGYGVFSVGYSQLGDLLKYIDSQAEHHRVRSFQEEYRDFLARYHIQSDERYVWD